MFYQVSEGHGLPHDPFNAIIAPRPIGWISSRSATGHDNLAPYSFFNGVAYTPPQLMFASTGAKDSLGNIRETGVFCVNVVSEAMIGEMNATSARFDAKVDEFSVAGIEKVACETIDCARVAGAPAALECRLTAVHRLEGEANFVVFGEVMGVYLRDDCMNEGRFDVTRAKPLARLGYRDYSAVRAPFELTRPDDE